VESALVIIGAGLVVLAIAIYIYMILMDSARNNLRKATGLHKKAENLYSEEKFEDAKDHYELARFYREKAERQLKGEN